MLYLDDKIEPNKKLSFFYNMCKAISLDEKHMISLSTIYALYGVFDGKPLTNEDLSKVNKRYIPKDCVSLVNRANYKKLDICSNACYLCKYSPLYKNARVEKELLVLRRLVEPTIPFDAFTMDSIGCFNSLTRLSDDYAIGTYPIAPLNAYLYDFLYTYSGERYEKKNLTTLFTQFLFSYRTDWGYSKEEFEMLIGRYIDDIYRITLDKISDSDYNSALYSLLKAYFYNPEGTIAVSIQKGVIPEKEIMKNKKFDDQLNIPEVSINISDVVSNDELDIVDSNCLPSSEKNEKCMSESCDSSIQNAVDDMDNHTVDNAVPSVDEINKMISHGILKELEESNSELYDFSDASDHVIDRETDSKSHTKNIQNDYTLNTLHAHNYCNYQQRSYIIPAAFENKIIVFNMDTSSQFMQDMSKSYYIGIEVVKFKGRKGLLLYSSYNWNFYFYDLEVVGMEPLHFQLTDKDTVFLSLLSIEVLSLLGSYGENSCTIHDLNLMYCISHSIECASVIEIVSNTLPINKPKNIDTYEYTMPLYRDLYTVLHGAFEGKKDLFMEYNRTLRLYSVLSRSYNMHSVSKVLEKGFSITGYRCFSFNFDWSQSFNNPGVLYRIELPMVSVSNGICSDSFVMDVCLLFINLPRYHRLRSYIISVDGKGLSIYYEGTVEKSRRFYDILMGGIRRSYAKRFNNELLLTTTYCVNYSRF